YYVYQDVPAGQRTAVVTHAYSYGDYTFSVKLLAAFNQGSVSNTALSRSCLKNKAITQNALTGSRVPGPRNKLCDGPRSRRR
ncbi:MAG: hypothetical protein NHG36_10885, partial [Chromatiaceae bacterium]|nr:hypothetical protein [Candidatus Thioaporhodococcus sediminis]